MKTELTISLKTRKKFSKIITSTNTLTMIKKKTHENEGEIGYAHLNIT